jgi:hypothetical protein
MAFQLRQGVVLDTQFLDDLKTMRDRHDIQDHPSHTMTIFIGRHSNGVQAQVSNVGGGPLVT